MREHESKYESKCVSKKCRWHTTICECARDLTPPHGKCMSVRDCERVREIDERDVVVNRQVVRQTES